MRALLCHEWGSVEALVVGDIAAAQPGPGQVLIDVVATAVNYADAIMVSGNYQTRPPLPFAPGLETAGVVAACGPGVTRVSVGQRVMALLHYGGMAEQALADETDVWPVPEHMPFAEAAAFPVAYLSSDVALRWQGRLAAGETLLVLGAAGGVGLT
ncbi:MAG: alcohol dehydrogenase catalytic domain-containing protein, partial [Gammaproteobacteria bacterium]